MLISLSLEKQINAMDRKHPQSTLLDSKRIQPKSAKPTKLQNPIFKFLHIYLSYSILFLCLQMPGADPSPIILIANFQFPPHIPGKTLQVQKSPVIQLKQKMSQQLVAITHKSQHHILPILNKPMLTQSLTKMRLHQSDIQTILCYQCIMTALLHYPSSIKHYNIVHMPHHCSPMCY